eukprot:449957-Amphidinium_carterae.1
MIIAVIQTCCEHLTTSSWHGGANFLPSEFETNQQATQQWCVYLTMLAKVTARIVTSSYAERGLCVATVVTSLVHCRTLQRHYEICDC